MKTIIALLVIGTVSVLILVLHKWIPPSVAEPGPLRKLWQKIIRIWDFITNFG
jgi:hypothetical protein